ncbi:MAG: DUF58 domain-containing protein [Deltaproteobacteria bacterium]|nr:DUF58 domain-containing protein [Deltaproteobacteria bacterium]
MRFSRIFRKPRATTSNGITCTTEELLDLRHTARSLIGRSNQKAYSIMAGSTISKFRGRGMDYVESRIYTPGDDIRSIDWRVTARSGKTHTKLYAEERDRPIMTLVDFSPSLYFGTKEAFKSVIAARLAATIAWTAAFNSDRIGGILLTPQERFELRPRAGRKGVLTLIHALVKATQTPATENGNAALDQVLHHGLRTIRPGSRIFLISDFYQLDQNLERNLSRLRRHNDLILCQIIDPLELEPPPPGLYNISNGRDQARLDTKIENVRQAYREKFNARRENLGRIAANLKTPYLKVVSGDDIAGVMRRGLSLRRGSGLA